METKQCKKCATPKTIGEFYRCRNKYSDGYCDWCKVCMNEYNKHYRLKNKGRMDLYFSKWRNENREEIKIRATKYRNINRQKIRQWKRDWETKARENPLYRINNGISSTICRALKGKKGYRHWEDLVGYTLEDLIKHLQSKFTEGISWDNYGTEWHVDHVVPKSWFKYENTDDPKFKECWALKNLQPKLKVDNIRKGNRFIG